jgi:WD40 repeat protein
MSNSLSPSQINVKLPERFIVTGAGRSTSGLLVLGSRKGGLAIYDLHTFGNPICTWTADHTLAGDAITSIVNIPNPTADQGPDYFLTTCRDGTYSVFRFTSPSFELTLVHQGTPPFGPMIEAAWFSGSELMLYGFKSKHFIVWNETKQYEVSSVECGGAHRSFAYSPPKDKEGAAFFIYTKASKLYLHSQTKPSHQLIKTGGHGREIKACAISEDGLIATGAEDTTIRIWRYDMQFDCLAVIQRHTTGIQHLQWHGEHYLLSSGGNEEFFVWAVESIPGFGIGMVCEATCPDQSSEKDLRIMRFDVSKLKDSARLLISLAYSDSTIRIYTYSKVERFRLIAKGRYSSSCLMQLRHLERQDNEIFIMTAATDGYLAVWKFPLQSNHSSQDVSSLTLVSTSRVHQSSIKSLAIAKLRNQIIVATGGDDNALTVTVYQSLDYASKSAILRSAHAAAITALSIVSSCDERLIIVTSGNDQRVKEWEVHTNTEMPCFKKIGDVFTSIADVGDLVSFALRNDSKVLAVGNGIEVYNLSRAQE